MPELRRDYFTDRLSITNVERSARGTDFQKAIRENEQDCFACEQTAKVKSNPFTPIVVDHPRNILGGSEPGKAEINNHFVIIASQKHGSWFNNLSIQEILKALGLAQENVKALYSKKENEFVLLISKYAHGPRSMPHATFELLGLPQQIPIVEEELSSVSRSIQDLGTCPMCSVISVEQGGPRQLISTSDFVAFSPWATTSAYEFWIYPKFHQANFLKTSHRQIEDLALILRSTLGGLYNVLGDVPFNMVFHTIDDRTGEYHWHIEVHPMWNKWGGLERGLQIFLNEISPETAGDTLGKASRKVFAELVGL